MLEFLIGVLAVYRLAVLLTEDDGPGDWFLWVRTYLGAYDYNPQTRVPRSLLGQLISCLRCVSVWLAVPVAVYLWWGQWGMAALGWLALSGGAVWLHEGFDHREGGD